MEVISVISEEGGYFCTFGLGVVVAELSNS